MAVTPTFPDRESLRRLRFRPVDIGVGLGVLLLIYAVIRVGAGARAPFHPGRSAALVSSSPAELPYYAARSLLRMLILARSEGARPGRYPVLTELAAIPADLELHVLPQLRS